MPVMLSFVDCLRRTLGWVVLGGWILVASDAKLLAPDTVLVEPSGSSWDDLLDVFEDCLLLVSVGLGLSCFGLSEPGAGFGLRSLFSLL